MRSSRPAFAPPVALVKVLGILPVLGQYSRQRVSRTVRPTIVAVHRPQTEQPNTRTEQAQRYRQRGFGKSALFVPVRSCSFLFVLPGYRIIVVLSRPDRPAYYSVRRPITG